MSGIKGAKLDSGSEKRKRKRAEEALIAFLKGSILKHLTAPVTSTGSPGGKYATSFLPFDKSTVAVSGVDLPSTTTSSAIVQLPVSDNVLVNVDWNDIGTWPVSLTKDERVNIVRSGVKRVINFDFPRTNTGRRFSPAFYERKLSNGEVINRRWLLYSVSRDSIYCFCCRLFSTLRTNFTTRGFNDWKHASDKIKEHELSSKHIQAQHDWINMENCLKTKQTIDNDMQVLMDSEKMYWRSVLERLLAIVHFLASRNLAFRGTTEKLNEPNNGNFLGLVELMSKFDRVMHEHVTRIKNREIHDHYLGKHIQNEFIQVISDHVRNAIVSNIKKFKYFSVILDCTPDVNHDEQMTMVLRTVEINDKSVTVAERFVGFLIPKDSTGIGLTDTFQTKLRNLGLSLNDLRGQGYDNCASMKGCYKGVQAIILQNNRRAFFVPCACHSLNLMIGDMAKSSVIAVTFFGIVQQIYVFFSGPTQRWEVLKRHVTSLTLKPLSDTRWECRIESVKALRWQIGDVFDALLDLSTSTKDPKCKTEALSLAKKLKNFQFLTTLVIWHDILYQFNLVSKLLQTKNVTLSQAMDLLQKTKKFLEKYRKNGFESAQISARELANELERSPEESVISPVATVRRRLKSKKFLDEVTDEPVHSPADMYRIKFFNVLLDQAVMSVTERFSQLCTVHDHFGFLSDISGLKCMTDEELQCKCKNLQSALSSSPEDPSIDSDLDALNLFSELKALIHIIPEGLSPLDALEYI